MHNTASTREIDSKRVREIFNDLADVIARAQESVTLSLRGNDFRIDLSDTTINITIAEKGGATC